MPALEGEARRAAARPLPATIDRRRSSPPGGARSGPRRSPPRAGWSPGPPRSRSPARPAAVIAAARQAREGAGAAGERASRAAPSWSTSTCSAAKRWGRPSRRRPLEVEVRPAWPYRLRRAAAAATGSPAGAGARRHPAHSATADGRAGSSTPGSRAGERVVLPAPPSADAERRRRGRRSSSRSSAMRFALGVDDDLSDFSRAFRRDPLLGPRSSTALAAPAAPAVAVGGARLGGDRAADRGRRAAAIQRRIVAPLGAPQPRAGACAPARCATSPAPPRRRPRPGRARRLRPRAESRAIALIGCAREVAAGRVDLALPERRRAPAGDPGDRALDGAVPRPQRPRRARLAARRRPRLREAGRPPRRASAGGRRSRRSRSSSPPTRPSGGSPAPLRARTALGHGAWSRAGPRRCATRGRTPGLDDGAEPRAPSLSQPGSSPGSSSLVSSSAAPGRVEISPWSAMKPANCSHSRRVHVAERAALLPAASSGRVASTSARVSSGSRPSPASRIGCRSRPAGSRDGVPGAALERGDEEPDRLRVLGDAVAVGDQHELVVGRDPELVDRDDPRVLAALGEVDALDVAEAAEHRVGLPESTAGSRLRPTSTCSTSRGRAPARSRIAPGRRPGRGSRRWRSSCRRGRRRRRSRPRAARSARSAARRRAPRRRPRRGPGRGRAAPRARRRSRGRPAPRRPA